MDKTLSYRNYCGSVEVSFEDKCLYGKILFITDLITYESDNVDGLETAFREAVDFYLEKCARENLVADKPFSGSFNVRVTPEKHRAASMKAASEGISLNELIGRCIDSYLEDVKTVLTINENHEHHHYADFNPVTVNYEETTTSSWTQMLEPRPKSHASRKPTTHH